MNSEQVISLYQAVAEITGGMLVAARAQDWERFCELEARGAECVQALKREGVVGKLPAPVREQKIRIIHQILAQDRAIRDITEPWMAQLSVLLNSARAERQVVQAYRGSGF